jgi:hypothetical protein
VGSQLRSGAITAKGARESANQVRDAQPARDLAKQSRAYLDAAARKAASVLTRFWADGEMPRLRTQLLANRDSLSPEASSYLAAGLDEIIRQLAEFRDQLLSEPGMPRAAALADALASSVPHIINQG